MLNLVLTAFLLGITFNKNRVMKRKAGKIKLPRKRKKVFIKIHGRSNYWSIVNFKRFLFDDIFNRKFIGETITWEFENTDDHPEGLRGNRFSAEIVAYDDDGDYLVNAEYGADSIPRNRVIENIKEE